MPKLINGHEVMTSQEWMQLGYPVFVTSRLEAINTDYAEDNQPFNIITPQLFAAMDTEAQLEVALGWEGIIGYTSQIVEAVRKLDQLTAAPQLGAEQS